MPGWLIAVLIIVPLVALLGAVVLWVRSRNLPAAAPHMDAEADDALAPEAPVAAHAANGWRRIALAVAGAIALFVLAMVLVVPRIDIPAFGESGRDENARATATEKSKSRVSLVDYSIRVIDPTRMDPKKWSATVYTHEVCSSKEILEYADKDGVIESDIPIEADGRISVELFPGNYRVGIGDGSSAHDGYLNVALTARGPDDRRFSFDPATKKCVQDRRAERVTVFSELENPKPVVAVVASPTPTPTPQGVTPPRVVAIAPAPAPAAPAPAPTQKPTPSFLFSASASPSTGVAPLTTTVGVTVTDVTSVSTEAWLTWVDCENNGVWEHSGVRMASRVGLFNCSYSSAGSHIVRVQMVLEENRSVTQERTTVVVVSAPAVVTTTATDAIEFDLVVGRYASGGPNPTQLVVTATASNVRGTAVASGYTVIYSFDCGADGSIQANGSAGSYTCPFYGSGTHRVAVTAVVRANGSGSTQTKSTTTDYIVR